MKVRKINKGVPFCMMYELQECEFAVTSGKKKEVKREYVEVPSFPKNTNGDVAQLPVDQFAGKKFFLNASGFPMNDIMIFEMSQSDSIARAALARIKDLGNRGGDGLTLQQRFDRIVPSNWSSPAEYVRASQTVARLQFEDLQSAAAARAAAVKPVEKPSAAPTVNVEPE